MHCKQWIFDMDGTLTDSMVVVWEGAPEALLARFGRTPKADLPETLLTMVAAVLLCRVAPQIFDRQHAKA